ncbi:hypothetical protein PGB90_003225 [Kerria lacca]
MAKRKLQDLPDSDESELEEGEITDSDSSFNSTEEEFNDGYDSDLMGDTEDRKKLSLMTEKEREQEIFKRIEVREAMKTRFNIEKKLKGAKKKQLKKQKIKEDYDSKQSMSDLKEHFFQHQEIAVENRCKMNTKFHTTNSLKACREEKLRSENKNEKMKEKKSNDRHMNKNENFNYERMIAVKAHKIKLKASDVYSDDSGSSSDENATVKNKHSIGNDILISSLSDVSSESDSEEQIRNNGIRYMITRDQLNEMKLSRHKLEKLIRLPFFKQLAVGCFVRIMFGGNSNRPVYRVCEITDVCEMDKTYQLGNINTNKGIRLRYGMQECVFRMEFASNQDFSENEFNKWREMCILESISIPTIEEMEKKVKDIKEAMAYEFKEDTENIKEKERFKNIPCNYIIRKNQLMKERDTEQEIGNIAKVNELQNELNQLESQVTKLDKLRVSAARNINYINYRNRKRNIEEAEKAILAERKASEGQTADDPFTRRHTKPSMVTKSKLLTKKIEISKQTTQTNVSAAVNEKDKENDVQVKKTISQKQNADMYAAHDFDIGIDFDVPLSLPTTSVVEKSVGNSLPKHGLNLEEYKRRKGFI